MQTSLGHEIEKTRHYMTALDEKRFYQNNPQQYKGSANPSSVLYPQMDKKMVDMAKQPLNLYGMQAPFADDIETFSNDQNQGIPVSGYKEDLPPIELPFSKDSEKETPRWMEYLNQIQNDLPQVLPLPLQQSYFMGGTQSGMQNATPNASGTTQPCNPQNSQYQLQNIPDCMLQSLKGTVHDISHWNQLPSKNVQGKLQETFLSNNRPIYLMIVLAVVILLIFLLSELFKKNKTNQMIQNNNALITQYLQKQQQPQF